LSAKTSKSCKENVSHVTSSVIITRTAFSRTYLGSLSFHGKWQAILWFIIIACEDEALEISGMKL